MSTYSFATQTVGLLTYTDVVATETDTGLVDPFITPSDTFGGSYGTMFVPGYPSVIDWSNQQWGAAGPGGSLNVDIQYNVSTGTASEAISRLQQSFTIDTNTEAAYSSLVVTETVYDSNNDVVGTLITNIAHPGAPPLTVSGDMALTAGYESLHVDIQIAATIAPGAPADATLTFSNLEQGFAVVSSSTLGSISSTVFCDSNADKTQDNGETGMSGVTVQLLNSTGTQVLETTTTDASGNYSFTDVPVGTYETKVIAPAGDIITTSNQGLDTGAAVTAGQNDAVAPTGLYMPAEFDVHVYYDGNQNGVQDDGDANLAGVSVSLLNGNGTPTGETAVTDANGNVSFTGLLPGSYEVSVTTPVNDSVSQDTNVMTPITLAGCGVAQATEGVYAGGTGGITNTPDVSIVKSVVSVGNASGDPAATYAGEAINYSIVVTNTGNETLTDVVVTDPTLGTTLGTIASLAAGATLVYSTSQTVTQAELDAGGPINNTAVVSDDQTPSQSSSVSTGVSLSPGVSIVKSVVSVGNTSGDPAATYAGESINYSVVVSNTGNETLTNVLVTDPTLGTTLGTISSLAPGASMTYSTSQTVTQAQLDAGGPINNTAVVTDDETSSQSSSVSTGVSLSPGVSIVKSVVSVGNASGDPAATYAGEAINYNVVVSNTGNETLTNVLVTDPTLGTTLGTISSLVPGASMTYSTSQSVTQAQLDAGGPINNTAVVTDDETPSQSSSVSTGVSLSPGVSIVKSVVSVGNTSGDPAATYAGEAINYNVVVSNTGNETLTNVLVTDPTLGTTLGTISSLAPGASMTYSTSQSVTQAQLDAGGPINNTAVVTDTQTPSQSSSVSTGVSLSPGVSIVKSVVSVGNASGDPAATYAGEAINYNVVVSNTGNETLTNVLVTDPTLGTTLGTISSLAPGASMTYSTSQSVTQAQLDAGGPINNTAVVTDTQTPSQSSSVSTGVSLSPGVSIVKSVVSVGNTSGDPAATYAGEAINYNVVVSNTGNETLTNVLVTDPTLGTTLGTISSLAPGASMTYSTSQSVTQAQLDAGGPINNTAVVTDTQTPSQSSSVSTGVSLSPGVSIVKSVVSVGNASGDPAATYAGEAINYNVVVSNTGNETLTNVLVTDPTLGTTLGTISSLAPGASMTYSTSQSVTQAQLDAGGPINNTAVVTDDETPSQSSSVSTGVSLSPGVSIVKSVVSVGNTSGDPAATYAGEAINYNVVVSNTGNETLTNVLVTDATLGTTLGTIPSLAPGATVTYSASQTVTQAELNSGNPVTNTAVVSDTQTPSHSSTASTGVSLSPGVSIVKSVVSVGNTSGDPAATYAGEAINYSIVVSNTGNETLTNVLVTDATLGTTLGTIPSLAPGATVTYSASQTVTQAELNSGNPVTNTAVVSDTQTPSQSSTASTGVSLSPGVSIVKSVVSVGNTSGDPAATYAGEAINYNIVVSNTGNETLTNVLVTDATLGTTLGTIPSLAPGATVTYSASQTVTQAELNSGNPVTNTAVVSDTQTPSQSSTASTGVSLSPGVSIVKTVTSVGGTSGDPAATYVGEAINYSIVVSNTGNETLTNVLVTDATLGTTLGTIPSLAPGATVTYSASQTVTQAELNSGNPVTNTAVVTDTQTPSHSSTASTGVSLSPGVSIVKTVTSVGGTSGDPAATYAGEAINYNIVVSNTGNETLTNVLVTDATLGTTLGTIPSLAPGATVTYSASQTVTQAELNSGNPVTNTAVVSDTQTPSQSSTASTGVSLSPGVSIVKTVTSVGGTSGDPAATYVGEAINYSIVVSNTGNETLTNVLVTDATLGTTLGTIPSLAPGATVTYSASQTVTQAELNSGNPVTNTAVVSDTQTPSQSSTASTGVSLSPGVSIVKTVTSVGGTSGDPAATYVGEAINYSIVVSNTGNETLTNVLVTDATLGTTLGTIPSLAPGATVTYSASQTVTQAELNSCSPVTNTAVVTDSQTSPHSSTASTAVSVSPGVSIVKTVTSVNGVSGDPAVTAAGEVIDYKIVVSNTGNETLTNVLVTDATLGTTLGTIPSLAPGATVTYSAAQTVTQAELNSCSPVTNTAVVTDTQTSPHSSTASTAVSVSPGVSIVKTVTSVGGVGGDPAATIAGEVIDYSIVVKNTGNETLTNVVVLDTTLGTTLGTIPSLAPGASDTYTASQTVTQTELNSGNPVNNTATVTDSQNVTASSTASTSVTPHSSGITVIKLPSQLVVGTCGQVTYTFDVINTGGTPLTNVQITDNIGTAANPDYITPTLQTSSGTGVLLPGQTWVYSATINESGDYSSKGGSQSCSVSGQNLGSGCTAWLNSSFTPTSCKSGATYTFQDISCTIKGPNCGTITVNVPNACVTFSNSCSQATTVYNASENCWVTTLPANCSPGNVFLSGIPCQVPSGCDLSGATVSWNIGQSANNCGTSNVSWQTGCTGYSSFDINNCNGQADYNQIGVKACDSLSGYGNGGNTNQGYGWNCNDSGSYCGSGNGWGGWSGCGSDWNGSSSDCAGTPENQYTGSNCCSGGNNGCGGGGYNGCGGGNNNGGTCGNGGGGGGTVSCGQLGDSSEADTVTVSANTLGSGFSLGDAGNYGIIAFAPGTFKAASGAPINGNVGVGTTSCRVTFSLGGDKITGNLVTTGTAPSSGSLGGTVTGSITGNSSTLTNDIIALQTLSLALSSETGTTEKLTSGMTINATSGTLDSAGDEVFTVTQWANNITINGTGANDVVLNIASGVTPNIDNVTLTGGITANQVLFNDQNGGTISGTSGDTFNATMLAPNAAFNVTGATVNGHLFGGASGQTFSFTSGATLNTPANNSSGTPTVTTVTASDSTEVQVLTSSSPISENGSTPTGSLSSLYGTAEKIEFTYNPSDTVSLKQIQAGLASETGNNTNSMAFIEITNNSNPYSSGATIYFEGEVQSGEKIYADATLNQLTNTPVAAPNNHFSTTAGADIFAYVFTSQAAFDAGVAPIQTMTYNTSGSQAMHFGDQIGSLTVVGYVGANGGHLVS